MGLHPYAFKLRLRSFNGLLVMILRHMREARELDDEIAQSGSKIDELGRRLEPLERRLNSIEGEFKRGGKGKKTKNLRKQIRGLVKEKEKAKKSMEEQIANFCRNVRKELKDFTKNEIDDYSLLYRGSKYIKHLAGLLVVSSKTNDASVRELKRQLVEEMRITEGKAEALELQAKHLERGVASTIVFSQISPLGNRWIEGRIKRKAIEVNQLHNILKNNEKLPKYFEKMILDIYEIGRNTNMLMKRLKATFDSVRTKLKNKGISSHELDKTQHVFKVTFRKMERMGKRLDNEIKGQVGKIASKLKAAA